MNNPEENKENTLETSIQSKFAGLDTNRKVMIGLGAALVVLAVALYAWKVAAVGAVEDKLAQSQAQHVQARAELIEQARQLDARGNEEALRRFGTPLAWAVRREVMAANLDQVDQYLTDLVQIRGFQSALLANPEGKVIVASDRKQIAAQFSSLYPAQYLQAGEIQVEQVPEGKLRAVIPIMGLNRRLGTLVLEYTPPPFTLQ